MTSIRQTAIIVALALSFVANVSAIIYVKDLKSSMTETTEVEEEKITDTLSDWDIFTLALMKVESEYNNDAVSSVGARGYFQMTPIYVKEVNRIHHTDYTFDQVTDFDKAYEIFDLMQKAHNPNYNMNKALELHNGKHEWYNKRVYKEMSRIKKYEEMRSKVKNMEI